MKKKLFLSLVAFAALALSACTPAANSNNNNNTDDNTQTSGDNSSSGDSSNTGTGDNQGSGSGNSDNTGSNTGDNTGGNTGGEDENQNVVKAILASGEQTLVAVDAEPDKYIVEQYRGNLVVNAGDEVSFTLNGVALPMYLSGDDTANNLCNNTTESPSDTMLSTYHVHNGGSVQVYVKHNKGTNEQGVDFDTWTLWISDGPSARDNGGNPGQEVDTTSIYIRGDAANGWEVGDLSEDYKFKPSEDANNQGELKGVTLKVGSFKVAKTNWDDYQLGWSYKNADESDDHLVVQSDSITNKSEYFEAGENGNIKVLKEGTFDIYLTVNNYLYIELVNGGSTDPVNPNPGEQEPEIPEEVIVDSLSLEVTHHHDWENMYVYLFKGKDESLVENAKWPGEKLTDGKDNGSGSLNYTVDLSGYSKVIFNNGVEGDGAAQTDDIVINDLVGKAGIYWEDNVLKSWSNPVATSEVWVKAGENAATEVTELSFDMSGEKVQHVLENVPLTSEAELSVARNEAFDSYDHIVLADDDEGLTASLVDAVETLVPTIKVKEDGKYNFYFIEQGDADNTIKVYVSKIQELSDIYSLHYGLSGAETWTTVADEKVSIVETEDENVKGQLKFADIVSDGTTAFKVFGPNDSTFGSKYLEVNPTEEDNDIVLPSGTFDVYFKLMKEGNPLIYISKHEVNLQYNIDLVDFASYGEDQTGVVYAYSWGSGLEAKAVQITGNTFELREGIEGFKIVLLAEAAKDDIFTDEVWASVIEGKDSGDLTVKGDRETAILKYVDGKFIWTYEGAPVSGYALKVNDNYVNTTLSKENEYLASNVELKVGDVLGAYSAETLSTWFSIQLDEAIAEGLFEIKDEKVTCIKAGSYDLYLKLDSENGDSFYIEEHKVSPFYALTSQDSWTRTVAFDTVEDEDNGIYSATITFTSNEQFGVKDLTNTDTWLHNTNTFEECGYTISGNNIQVTQAGTYKVYLYTKNTIDPIGLELEGVAVPRGKVNCYIRGLNDDWDTSSEYQFVASTDNNKGEFECTLAVGDTFKVADSNWGDINLGYSAIKGGSENFLESNGNIYCKKDGTYKFFVNASNELYILEVVAE